VPILINVVVAGALYATLLNLGVRLVGRYVDLQGDLGTIVRVLVGFAVLLATGFLFARIGFVLGAPWYSRLAEEVEALRLGTQPRTGFRPGEAAADLFRALRYEAAKLAFVLAAGLGLLLFNLVPVAGQVAGAVGGLLLGAVVACLDFFDGPLGGLPLRAKLRFIRRTAPASLGFGLASAAMVAVPLVNLVSLPLCMAAGTLFVLDRRPS
jgi:CysZ protein